MHLTLFSDYALRLALYLTAHGERPVPLEEVSRAYGISKNHLVKVSVVLLDLGVIESQRGRGGGLRLAMRPRDVRVGWLVRRTEPHMNLVECFDEASNTCPISPVCGLKGLLDEAREAFLAALDRCTLADLAAPREKLVPLWRLALDSPPERAVVPRR